MGRIARRLYGTAGHPYRVRVRKSSLCWLLLLSSLSCAGACDKKKGGDGPKGGIPANDNPAPMGSGGISGVVKLTGDPPAPTPWGGTAAAQCKTIHAATIQLVKVDQGKVEDVFVWVKGGLPTGTYAVPTNAITLDQKGCEFTPRVFGIRLGQPLEATNSDAFMHNVSSPDFNAPFPVAGAKRTLNLETEGMPVTIKCDVHGWMRAYAFVMKNPFYATTKNDGAFAIKGLIDGDYDVAAWHETLGTVEQKVKVTGGATASVTFEFKK